MIFDPLVIGVSPLLFRDMVKPCLDAYFKNSHQENQRQNTHQQCLHLLEALLMPLRPEIDS